LAELVGYKMGDGVRRELLDLTRRYVEDRYPVEGGAEGVPEGAEDAQRCLELTKIICRDLDDMASRRN
jgi:HEPN domain-containing protein